MTHEMNLNHLPFTKIKSGEKTVELRLYDEKRRKISVGDSIIFTDATDGEKIVKQVIALHIYASFELLYGELPLDKCGYGAQEAPTASHLDMRAYYTEEQEKKFGVVGIELR